MRQSKLAFKDTMMTFESSELVETTDLFRPARNTFQRQHQAQRNRQVGAFATVRSGGALTSMSPRSTVDRHHHAARRPWCLACIATGAGHPDAAIASIGARAIAFQRSVAVVLTNPPGIVAGLAGHISLLPGYGGFGEKRPTLGLAPSAAPKADVHRA